MEYDKNVCPVLEVDGVIDAGKQFDLDITLPEDNRNVIYGIVKDCYCEPVCNAVVKLIEIVCDCGKEERRPVSHTFTDEDGEFVFGPLCANKLYAIQIWVDQVKHCKICATSKQHDNDCLKGIKSDCKHDNHCKTDYPCKPEHPCKSDCPCKPERPCKPDCPCKPEHDKTCDKYDITE